MRPIIAAGFLLLAACAGTAALEMHRDPAVPFTGMRTFRILPNHYTSATAPESVIRAKREIERAIQDVLVAKGYYMPASGPVDFEVEYVMYVTERYQEGAHDRYIFEDRVRLLGGAEPVLDNPIREGTLHIHLLMDGRPFYEAIATGVIETGMDTDKRIRATVPEMLSDVPAAH